jgi:peptide/nickel transport system substrate-binding protein
MQERNYWSRMRRRRVSRRTLLGASARAGVGAAGLALVGCGDDDDEQQAAAQRQPAQQQQQAMAEQQAQQADQQQAMQDQQDEPQQAVSAAPSDVIVGGTRTAPFVGPYSGDPPTLDPYENLTYRTQIPSAFHYSKLIQAVTGAEGVDPINTAEYEGDLAGLPEIPDDVTYIFTVRDDAYWHDVDPLNGRAVEMDDIQQTHDRFKEISANAAGWDNVVEKFSIGEDRSITFALHRPHAPFLTLAGSSQHMWIIPQEIVDDGTVAQRPVGSGPWIFEEFEPGVAINWRRNPNWHRSRDYVNNMVDSGAGGYNGVSGVDPQLFPLMDGVTATMNGDVNVLIPALGDGSLDYSQLSPAIFKQAQDAAPDIEETAGYVFTNNTVPGGFYFNYSIPPWNDVRVRLALSYSQDRDGILAATDDTGRGGWHSPLSQIAPYWLDPRDLDTYGETFEGEPSGLTFHRDIAMARQLLDAAGYPEGVKATLHGTADYGTTVVNLYEACASSASEAGFQFEFFFKEYAAYIASIFRGNFPDGWDGESSHLAIGPLYGGATDPEDLFAACYARSSGRHNWGSGGRVAEDSVTAIDTGGNAALWSHPSAVSGGGPETDERLHTMFDEQKAILDLEERIEYINEIQRYMATKMYLVPYPAAPGVYAFNPWMKQVDVHTGGVIENASQRMWPKATYGWGGASEFTFMLDQDIKDQHT